MEYKIKGGFKAILDLLSSFYIYNYYYFYFILFLFYFSFWSTSSTLKCCRLSEICFEKISSLKKNCFRWSQTLGNRFHSTCSKETGALTKSILAFRLQRGLKDISGSVKVAIKLDTGTFKDRKQPLKTSTGSVLVWFLVLVSSRTYVLHIHRWNVTVMLKVCSTGEQGRDKGFDWLTEK